MFRAFPSRRPRSRGNALVPVLLILAALAVSALIFFFFTRPHMERGQDSGTVQSSSPAPSGDQTKTTSQPAAPPAAAPITTTPASSTPAMPAPTPVKPATPEELAKNFATLLSKNDLTAAAKAMTGDDPAQAAAVEAVLDKVIHGLGYQLTAPGQPQIIGQQGSTLRLAIPLTPPVPGAPASRLMFDLERDEKGEWKVSKIHLPKELEPALASLPPSVAPGTAAAAAAPAQPFIVVDQAVDALVFASDFVNTLLRLEFPAARKLVNTEKVSPVKLAALCIVFEDGKYRLADTRPIVATVSTENSSWVIVRIWSESQKQQTEFGLEMEKTGPEWRISGLNLSKILGDSARVSSANGVPYTPLVQRPKGGDSIALYFEFDQAALHPRAQKQLDIVVNLLKASPTKKLTIGGFTDAHGSDEYNISLSQRRAAAVKEYIISHGVPQTQVETSAFGKSSPLSPNANPDGSDNPEGRSHNRRAEILLDF